MYYGKWIDVPVRNKIWVSEVPRQVQSCTNNFFKLVYLKFMWKFLGGLLSKFDHYASVICLLVFTRSSPHNFLEIIEAQNSSSSPNLAISSWNSVVVHSWSRSHALNLTHNAQCSKNEKLCSAKSTYLQTSGCMIT